MLSLVAPRWHGKLDLASRFSCRSSGGGTFRTGKFRMGLPSENCRYRGTAV